jgi:hypothetical protein
MKETLSCHCGAFGSTDHTLRSQLLGGGALRRINLFFFRFLHGGEFFKRHFARVSGDRIAPTATSENREKHQCGEECPEDLSHGEPLDNDGGANGLSQKPKYAAFLI